MAKLGDLVFAMEMPQPLELEANYLSDSRINGDDVLTRSRSRSSTGERSLWTAKQLIKIAKDSKNKKIHYLGGLTHTSEIAYFLNNPDYSFDRLREYRARRG